MINYDSDRGVSVKNDNEGSTLLLENASAVADSGNYTCSPYNIRPSWVVVHVLGKGNSAAAVQVSQQRCSLLCRTEMKKGIPFERPARHSYV